MNQTSLFAPFAGTMILALVVWIYMYARRIPSIFYALSAAALWFMVARVALTMLG